ALCDQSLRRQDTGDCERHLFDSQDLADRIFVSINLRGGGATDHPNLVRPANVLRCKRRAISQRPLPDVKIIRGLPVNAGKPILISGGYLRGGNNFLAYSNDARHFPPNRLRVFDFQRAGAPPPGANAAGSGAAGEDEDHILSETGDLRFYLRLRSVADPNHRNHRAHTNDDSESSQHRTQFVSPQSAECDVKCWCDSHRTKPECWSSGDLR